MKDDSVVLIEEYRGPLLENKHRGWVCVLDENEQLLYHAGNPDHVTYMRSSAKPLQALAFFALRLDEVYDLTDQEKTILSGSHQGGPYHVAALESIARKMKIDEDALVLLPCYPADAGYRDQVVAAHIPPRKFYHNCAGKHLATIAMARFFGQPEDTYYQIGTPVQEYLANFICELTGCPRKDLILGVDGCGVPVYGMSLRHMATAYSRLIQPEKIENETLREKVKMLDACTHAWPQYINKENYVCTCMNEDSNIWAKGGAQGVYCFAIRDKKLAVSFKVEDGSEEEWQLVIWNILRQLGYEDSVAAHNMVKLRPFEIINATGHAVGEYRPVFTLEKN